MHSFPVFAKISNKKVGVAVKKQLSFIHTADLHLDSPFKGLRNVPESIFKQIRNSTFQALDQLVAAAIQKKVDFVVIAGDLFDNEKQSLKAQIRLKRAFEELKKHNINVYVSYGNHDYINGNRYPVTYPDNVFVFPDEQVRSFTYMKDQQELAMIYGFSYEERGVVENKTTEYDIAKPDIPFHIAMLHGSVGGNKEHDVYAPFQVKDLVEKDFDYWALGHIHKRRILHERPLVVYPGNIQGRHRKETGEKGCYHVTLTKTDRKLSFIPLHSISFQPLTVDVSECKEVHQVEAAIQHHLKQIETKNAQLIDLTLTANHFKLKEWESEQLLEEIIDLVNETSIHRENWQYVFRVTVETESEAVDPELIHSEHFIGELFRQFEDTSIQPYLTDLYQHKQARKFMNPLTGEEEAVIKEKAKQLLMNELLKG